MQISTCVVIFCKIGRKKCHKYQSPNQGWNTIKVHRCVFLPIVRYKHKLGHRRMPTVTDFPLRVTIGSTEQLLTPPLIQSDRSKDQEPSITTRQLKNLKLIQAIKPPLYFSLATPCWQTECHPSHCCLFLYWLIYYKWKCYKIAIRRGLGGINLEWTNHCGTEWKIKAWGYVSVGKENKQVPFLNR